MKIGFLFAGQSTQYVGMGQDLYEKYDIAKNIYNTKLDFDVKDLCFNGPLEKLSETKYSQPCIFLTSLAIANILRDNGIEPEYVAGLSLGEYSALTFANAFNVNDAIKIISYRGKIMQEALPENKTGMLAVLALDEKTIKKAIKGIDGLIEIANYNCPGQIVLTGEKDALEKAIEPLTNAGARRCIFLNVSGAFHSSLLNDASDKLFEELNKYEVKEPSYKVVYNTLGTPSNDDIRTILKSQIKSSVRFEQSIRYMIENGVDTFIEIGPGSALSGFVKKTNRDVKVYSVSTCEQIETVIGELKR